MRDVNRDRLRELAGHLRDSIRQLRELGAATRTAFLTDARTVNSAKYRLIRENLGDFEDYLAAVGRYLGAEL